MDWNCHHRDDMRMFDFDLNFTENKSKISKTIKIPENKNKKKPKFTVLGLNC